MSSLSLPSLTRLVVLLFTCNVTIGCSTAMHAWQMSFSSPGEKTCSLTVLVNKSPSSADFSLLKISGGFIDHEKGGEYGVETRKYAKTQWNIQGYDHSWVSKSPCIATSPISVTFSDDQYTWTGFIPTKSLESKKTFGTFFVVIDGEKAQLVLFEVLDRYSYKGAAGRNGWDSEPERVISEVVMLKARK